MTDTEHAQRVPEVPGGPGLLEGVSSPSNEKRDALIACNREVRTASTYLRAALDDLHTSEDVAWRSYADEVDRALVHLDVELQVAAARLRAERAESRDELSVALHEAAESWRSRRDDARVQARLLEMERRDAGRSAVEELHRARTEVERALSGLSHDLGATLQEARQATVSAIGRVAGAVRHLGAVPI